MSRRLEEAFLAYWMMLGMALLLLGGIIGRELHHSRVDILEREQLRLLTQARLINENLGRQLWGTDRALLGVRNNIVSYTWSLRDSQHINSSLKLLVESIPGIRTLVILDANGIVRFSNRQELPGFNAGSREYFLQARQNPDPSVLFVSAPYQTVLGAWGMNLTRVIPGESGEFAGIVVATLDPEYFKTLLSSVNYSPDMWSAIAHGDGIQFMTAPEQENRMGRDIAQPGSFFTRHRESGRTENVLTGTSCTTGEERMMALQTIKPRLLPMDKPLIVTVGRADAAITKHWRKDAVMQGATFALVALASVSALAAFQRRRRAHFLELERADADLRESAERLRLATEAAGVGVWEYNFVTGRLVWDASMFAIYGVAPTAFSSAYDAWWNSLLPEDRETAHRTAQEAFEGEKPYDTEFRIVRGDGEVRTIRAIAQVERNENGQPVRIVGTNKDVTVQRLEEAALRRAKEAAEEATRAKSVFLANMSHEIRTPMNSILGFIHLALETELSPGQRDYLHKANHSARTLLGIINDILDYSKSEAGKIELERVVFSLDGTLQNIANLFFPKIEKKGLELLMDVAPDAPRLLTGDPLRLEQVISNLVANSVKFTETGGIRIRVEMQEQGESEVLLRFSVQDTGIGLSEEEIGRLFRPFTQSDNSITRRYGGTGLGLAISRYLITLMGGAITVAGSPGQGCTFSFTARFGISDRATEHPKPDVTFHEMVRPIHGSRILLVEDNRLNRELAQEFLERAGFHVTTANHGGEGVERIRAARFDAVLMDLQMPGMDGFQACALMRELPHGERVPIIAMTAAAMPGDKQACIEAGMNGHVSKPVMPHELLNALLEWIPHKNRGNAVELPASFSSEPFPPIAGIDGREAAMRMGGDIALFDSLLSHMVTDCSDTLSLVRADLSEGRSDEAAHRLHTLRGVVGNISAVEVTALALQAETAISEGNRAILPELLASLEASMERLTSDVGRYLAEAKTAAGDGALDDGSPHAPGKEEFARLTAALKDNSIKAMGYFDALRQDLARGCGSGTVDNLAEAVEALRFGDALAILERIAKENRKEE